MLVVIKKRDSKVRFGRWGLKGVREVVCASSTVAES